MNYKQTVEKFYRPHGKDEIALVEKTWEKILALLKEKRSEIIRDAKWNEELKDNTFSAAVGSDFFLSDHVAPLRPPEEELTRRRKNKSIDYMIEKILRGEKLKQKLAVIDKLIETATKEAR